MPQALFLYLLGIVFTNFVDGDFNPFADNDLFSINWAGPPSLESDKLDVSSDNVVLMQTAEDEKYKCILPETQATGEGGSKGDYHGPTPDELMEGLFSQSSCSYRIESYWTYELCHGKHIRQYHENKELGPQKAKIQEYYLGVIKESKQDDKSKKPQVIQSMKIDGIELPYYEVNMTHGTACDLTGKPRRSRVLYVCQPDGRGEVYQMKELSTCVYDIIVLTAALCKHPGFKPKDPPVSKIHCHSLDGSPRRPKQLQKLEVDKPSIQVEEDDKDDEADDEKIVYTGDESSKPKPVKKTPPKVPDTTIGPTADKQLLREFLEGDFCLHGGGGWWKHEFCFKKHARQYHDEQDGQRTSIFLGYWDESKHLKWIQQNPSKRPKEKGQRKSISVFYSDGDVCDLSGKKRFVEVKLKCLKNSNHPHAVSIYLIEPKPCEYILGVESPILCDLLDKADDNGLFTDLDL